MKYVLVGIVLLVVVVYLFSRKRQPAMKVGEILPAGVMKEKYGLTAENRPTIEIDAENVPAHLRDLIPLAEKWGVGDDIIRNDIQEKADESELTEFKNALRGRTDQVTAWLDSFDAEPGTDNPMSEEAGYFMYMLLALDESGHWPD